MVTLLYSVFQGVASCEMVKDMPDLRKAIVVHSPGSGRSEQLTQAIAALHETGVEVVESISITAISDQPAQGHFWRKNGVEFVVAAGGDGLLSGVIGHIIASDLPLGILPLGTANDVARTVNIPLDLQQAAEIIAHGKLVDVDIAVALPAEQVAHNASKPTYFAQALTVGLNVQFARLATDNEVRQQYGTLTYPVALIEALKNYTSVEVELHFDGLAIRSVPSSFPTIVQERISLRCRAAQAMVANSAVFGGALQATLPGASLNDRLLDIVVVEDASLDQLLLRLVRFFSRDDHTPPEKSDWHARYPDLLPAQLTDIPGIHHIQARSVTIAAVGEPQEITLDGELSLKTPVSICVADARLRLIVPQSAT